MSVKKSIAYILTILMLTSCLFGCGSTDTTVAQNSVESSFVTEATSTSAESTTSVDTELEAPIVLTPVDIETPGGIVIVGQIGKDEQGWHIRSETPMNIFFQYFLEKPSVYNDTTRIQMFDPSVDGVEKALYIGQTVTAGGTLRFYRDDFETLYFSPYTITVGKLAEHSYSAPDLQMPDFKNLYDPSLPLPEAMALTSKDGVYTYNPYMLSIETLELMGNDFADFYVGFVDAFLNHETEYPCTNRDYAELLSMITDDEFPLYNACAVPFEFFRHYDAEKGTITITYKYDKAEHDRIVEQFFSSANSMLAGTSVTLSDEENARIVYHALSTRMTYDYSALEEFDRKDSYYAYLYNSGVCVTFANVYNQLLARVGIVTTLAHCDNVDTIGHTWSVITLDGQMYFCDPTYELSYDGGSGYHYFGMNYADRTADGTGKLGIRCGRYNLYQMDPSMIAAESLAK